MSLWLPFVLPLHSAKSIFSNYDFGHIVYEGQKYLRRQWGKICDIRSVLENQKVYLDFKTKSKQKQENMENKSSVWKQMKKLYLCALYRV